MWAPSKIRIALVAMLLSTGLLTLACSEEDGDGGTPTSPSLPPSPTPTPTPSRTIWKVTTTSGSTFRIYADSAAFSAEQNRGLSVTWISTCSSTTYDYSEVSSLDVLYFEQSRVCNQMRRWRLSLSAGGRTGQTMTPETSMVFTRVDSTARENISFQSLRSIRRE